MNVFYFLYCFLSLMNQVLVAFGASASCDFIAFASFSVFACASSYSGSSGRSSSRSSSRSNGSSSRISSSRSSGSRSSSGSSFIGIR